MPKNTDKKPKRITPFSKLYNTIPMPSPTNAKYTREGNDHVWEWDYSPKKKI